MCFVKPFQASSPSGACQKTHRGTSVFLCPAFDRVHSGFLPLGRIRAGDDPYRANALLRVVLEAGDANSECRWRLPYPQLVFPAQKTSQNVVLIKLAAVPL